VVVVDDASDDDTPARVVELQADPRVRSLRTETQTGAAAARNAGVAATTGELIGFLDDDDAWLPEKAERQLSLFDSHPGVVEVASHYTVVDGDAATVYRGPTRCTAAELLWCNFVGGMSVTMVRRSALDEPALDPTLTTCEDWDLHLRCARRGGVVIVPEPLCRYSARPDGRLTTSPALRAGWVAFVRKHASAMSTECLAYHRARLRLLGEEGLGEGAAFAAVIATTPPRVTALVARESLAGRLGARAGDPGRGMRTLHRLVSGAARDAGARR
jgi:GT2 family glycosyltransferase